MLLIGKLDDNFNSNMAIGTTEAPCSDSAELDEVSVGTYGKAIMAERVVEAGHLRQCRYGRL
jgi:hypothetical protein